MVDDKLRKLIDRLLTKTNNSELRWSETSSESAFQSSFPNYSVEIEKERGPIVMRIYNSDGRVIDWINQDMLDRDTESVMSIPTYSNRLQELFNLARRQALGVDKALDEILDILD